jgi:dextranase
VKSAYRPTEPIKVEGLPNVDRLTAEDALGHLFEASVNGGAGSLGPLPPATYRITAHTGGRPVASELITVEAYPGASPVPAFATSTGTIEEAEAVASFTRRLRATFVQVYDWMAHYSEPMPTADRYSDPLGRILSAPALRALNAAVRTQGAVAQAYAPVYGADLPAAKALPELRLYRPDGSPERLADLVAIMHPGRSAWIARWLAAWGRAQELGFAGFHLDTYGYPRAASDADGRPVDMAEAFSCFLGAVRGAMPDVLLTFNQVNTHPAALALAPPPSARYVEVWPPNDGWRHLEGVLARAGARPDGATVLAIYPPVWGGALSRADALRTACLTEAVVTALGADILLWGDDQGVLCDPYYPRHTRLEGQEVEGALTWHRFALGVRDLFQRGRDTSWEDLGGVNRAVIVDAPAPAAPEPLGGRLFGRVRRGHGWVAVSLLDLTGSDGGLWTEPTAPGRLDHATLALTLPQPGRWRAEVARLAMEDGSFRPQPVRVVPHDEGSALAVDIRDLRGWAVVRLRTDEAAW